MLIRVAGAMSPTHPPAATSHCAQAQPLPAAHQPAVCVHRHQAQPLLFPHACRGGAAQQRKRLRNRRRGAAGSWLACAQWWQGSKAAAAYGPAAVPTIASDAGAEGRNSRIHNHTQPRAKHLCSISQHAPTVASKVDAQGRLWQLGRHLLAGLGHLRVSSTGSSFTGKQTPRQLLAAAACARRRRRWQQQQPKVRQNSTAICAKHHQYALKLPPGPIHMYNCAPPRCRLRSRRGTGSLCWGRTARRMRPPAGGGALDRNAVSNRASLR